jgi:uncharacterized protein (DUF2062 family)
MQHGKSGSSRGEPHLSVSNPTEQANPLPKKRRFWHRWLIDPVAKQLTQGVTPQKVALSLAVGSALALFPILGTTTTLCIIAGITLGLNQPIIQGVNALCTFIYFPLLYGFVRLGDTLARTSRSSLDIPLMISLFTHEPRQFFRQFGVTALHAILGWVVVAPFWIPLVYLVALRPLQAAARRIARN